MTESPPNIVAAALSGFRAYRERFAALTARAEARFRAADWRGLQADSTERLDVYDVTAGPVPQLVASLDDLPSLAERFERRTGRTVQDVLGEGPE